VLDRVDRVQVGVDGPTGKARLLDRLVRVIDGVNEVVETPAVGEGGRMAKVCAW
jgi:hypothetical protein